MKTKAISNKETPGSAPQRTCIACRNVFNKRDIVRIVSTGEGRAEADIRGKMPGRGAYLCRNLACWEEGLKGNRLEHALKSEISRESKNELLDWIKTFLRNSEENK